jgi:type II secretory pathway pseudopilin PulG
MRRRRSGFTIIELLVSISLVILIMAVLAEAFTVGLNTFSGLKAIGDMSDRLRAATHQIRRDLAADHFEGAIRLSDPTFQTRSTPAPGQAPDWPREGFVYIRQFGPSNPEGTADGVPSYSAPGAGGGSHVLYMTVKLKGNRRDNFFGATAPAGAAVLSQPTTFFNQPPDARCQDAPTLYTSQWAEVAYFLQPLVDQNGKPLSANGTPMYTLNRVVRVLVADNRAINGSANPNDPNYNGFSLRSNNGQGWFNTPLDVTTPVNRSMAGWFQQADPCQTSGLAGVPTILLTDVVSFDVQAIPAPVLPPPPMQPPPSFGFPVNAAQQGGDSFVDMPAGGVFDSSVGWPSQLSPNGTTGITAVQVTIRVWDLRTQQTRQITVIQDM